MIGGLSYSGTVLKTSVRKVAVCLSATAKRALIKAPEHRIVRLGSKKEAEIFQKRRTENPRPN